MAGENLMTTFSIVLVILKKTELTFCQFKSSKNHFCPSFSQRN